MSKEKKKIADARQQETSQAKLLMRSVDLIKQGINVAHLMGSCSDAGPEFIMTAMILVNADFLYSYTTAANLDKEDIENIKKMFFEEISNKIDDIAAGMRKDGN